MIRAVVFDAYGTLFDVHSVVQRCETFFHGKGAQLSQLWRSKQLEYTWQRSLMRQYKPFSSVTLDALVYACRSLGLDLTEERRQKLMAEYLTLDCYPDVRAALQKFAGMKKAILSNGSPDMLDPLVKFSGLEFDAVLSVDAVKIFKPAPEVYELATRSLKAHASEVGFVSSNCWDALGARSYGFLSYWINRTGSPVDLLGVAPDGILRSLGDLPQILRR